MITSVLSLSLLSTCLVQEPQSAQDSAPDPWILRTVSVRHLLGLDAPEVKVPRVGSLLSWLREPGGRVESDRFDPDWLSSCLQDYVAQRFVDAEESDLAIDVRGGDLDLIGPKVVVDTALDLLVQAEALLASPIEVDVVLYRLEDGASTQRLPVRTTVDALGSLDGVTELWRSHSRCRSGQSVVAARRLRESSYVRTLDPETSEDSVSMDPVIARAVEGIDLALECHACPDDSSRTIVYGLLTLSRLKTEPAASRVAFSKHGTIEMPEIESHQVALGGKVGDGEVLLTTFRSADPEEHDLMVAIQAKSRQVPTHVAEDVMILPYSALTTTYFGRELHVSDELVEGRVFPLTVSESEIESVSGDSIADLLRTSVADEMDNGEADISVRAGYVMVTGTQSARTRVRKTLMDLYEQRLRFGSLEVETALRGDDAGWVRRIALPVVLGRPHFVVHGVEGTSIRDVDSWIAKSAAILGPHVSGTFRGWIANCATSTTLTGDLACDVELLSIHRSPEVRRPSLGFPDGGTLVCGDEERSEHVFLGTVDTDGGGFEELGDVSANWGSGGASNVATESARFRLRRL